MSTRLGVSLVLPIRLHWKRSSAQLVIKVKKGFRVHHHFDWFSPISRTTMSPPPNELYTAFSFIGFVFCAIPFYWHLEGGWKHWAFTWLEYSSKIGRHSLEYGHLLVYDLDRSRMLVAIHQLHRMERERDQQGSGLLRYRYDPSYVQVVSGEIHATHSPSPDSNPYSSRA